MSYFPTVRLRRTRQNDKLRALVRERQGTPGAWGGPMPGVPTVEAFLADAAGALARQP